MSGRRRGFTLLEAILATSLFLVVFFMIFAVFELGSYHFHVGLMRQGVQTEVRKSWLALDRDLRQTVPDGVSVATAGRNVTVPLQKSNLSVSRHIVCMPALSDWQPNGSTFDGSSGLPLWDRYIIYDATLNVPEGLLYRIEIAPGVFGGETFPGFSAAATALAVSVPGVGSTLAGAPVKSVRQVAAGVFSFTVNAGTQIQVVLKLRGKAHSESGQSERDETFEVNLNITPNNQLS